MDRNRAIYQAYLAILHEELVPAMGCTEPIAVAYAGAPARKTLGAMPEKAELTVSGNIIKNVKSAIVPRTGGRKGLRTALAAGICYGDSDRELEVLANAAGEQQAELDSYLGTVDISIKESDANCPFDLQAAVWAEADEAHIRIIGRHTNGLLGMQKNLRDSQFCGGDGILVKGVENTIRAVSVVAREGMRDEIIHIMMEND